MRKASYKHLAHVAAFAESPITFFTVVAFKRRPLLACEAAHAILRDIWTQSAERNGWWVGDYIVMPDHVHFFARGGRTSMRMCDWMRTWKSLTSRRIAAALQRKAPIWQEEYFDRYLRSSEDYSEKWEYIERNALADQLVNDPDEWPYRGRIHDLRF